jgi:hypothetical protein
MFKRVEHEVSPHRTAHPPTHDAPGKDVDDEGEVDKALPCRDVRVSRPWEYHPRPLSEPDVNLSAHPAPIIQLMGIS